MKQTKFLIPASIILGGIGALIFNWYPLYGGLLIAVGVMGALYSWRRAEATTEEYENFIETQAFLIAKGGLGNTFTQSVKKELESGYFLTYEDILNRLRRALELTPDDVETLELLSMVLALKLSFGSWVAQDHENSNFRDAVAEAKSLAEKGRKLAPTNHILLSSLGIICDLEGSHEQARHYFLQAGKNIGPYWRLHVSTSFGMEGKYSEALAEVEKAIEEGASGWMVDFYYGRALNSHARYDEALNHLLRAQRRRGSKRPQPQLLRELMTAANFSGYPLTANKYGWLLGISMLRGHPKRGLFELLASTGGSLLYGALALSKKLWRYTQRVPGLKSLHVKLVSPDEPEATLLCGLAKQREYDAALVLAKRTVQIRPDKQENHWVLIMLLANVGKRSEALAACEQSLERWPGDVRLQGLCRTVAETDYIFRCVHLPGNGDGWRAEERKPPEVSNEQEDQSGSSTSPSETGH